MSMSMMQKHLFQMCMKNYEYPSDIEIMRNAIQQEISHCTKSVFPFL